MKFSVLNVHGDFQAARAATSFFFQGIFLIIYQATKSQFLDHALRHDIEDVVEQQYRQATGHGVAGPEMAAWKHSLLEMAKVLLDDEIPADAGVAIEYQLPQSSKRIDFVIAGEDADARTKLVIVELKQWSESRRSDKDAIIWARRGGRSGEREGPHPSYQAWSYAMFLQDFNGAVQDAAMNLQPCAYLHNHPRDGEIDNEHYREHIERAPLFLKREQAKLQAFIRQHVKFGDRKNALYAIEHGRIRPSKLLMESVAGLLQGKPEFTLIDDQKVVHEAILEAAARARTGTRKQVVIVQGGPGTGKSVVAVNLLGTLICQGHHARYVSKNAAPRAVFEAKLAGTFKRTRIANLFSGSGAYVDTPGNTWDTLVVDEAHRLNEKSGLYRNLGDHQVKELIHAARCTVFFVDDDQRVTLADIGHTEELRRHARAAQAEITELSLSSQFRCNGSDGYLAWLDNTLDIRPTANPVLSPADYDFRVFDDPQAMHTLIEQKNRLNNRSRMVAGYCWAWPSRKDPSRFDIELPEHGYQRRWNLDKDGSLWIVADGSVEQVGCIHTCQGLELDYVGVIIGPDLVYRDRRVMTDATRRAPSDQSVKGLKKMLKDEPAAARELADLIVKNTYRTLMTRGMKGCFVHCVDPALATYLRSRMSAAAELPRRTTPPMVQLPNLPGWRPADAQAAVPAAAGLVPVLDLRRAVGTLNSALDLGGSALAWFTPPGTVAVRPGMFIAQAPRMAELLGMPSQAWFLMTRDPVPDESALGDLVKVDARDMLAAESRAGSPDLDELFDAGDALGWRLRDGSPGSPGSVLAQVLMPLAAR